MALYDAWTLAQLQTRVSNELVDPANKFWSQAEITGYLNEWQWTLQSIYEFQWTTSTYLNTSGTSTLTLTNVCPNQLRLDAIYFCPGGTNTLITRLSPRSLIDLDIIQRNWRALNTNTAGLQPEVSYQQDLTQVNFWPPVPGTSTGTRAGTYVFEYPVLMTLVNSTDTMQLPPWTRYSASDFCAFKAFKRFGPNQDIPKALRYRKAFEHKTREYREMWNAFMPERSEVLRPGRKYMGSIIIPRQFNLQVP